MADLMSIDFPLRLPTARGHYLRPLSRASGAPRPQRRVWEFSDEASATNALDEEVMRCVAVVCGPPRARWAVPGATWLEVELRPHAWLPPARLSGATLAALAAADMGVAVSVRPDPEGVEPTEPQETGYTTYLGGDKYGAPEGLPCEWPSGLALALVPSGAGGAARVKESLPGYFVSSVADGPLVEDVSLADFEAVVLSVASQVSAAAKEELVVYMPSDHDDLWLHSDLLRDVSRAFTGLAVEVTPGEPHRSYIAAFNAAVR